MIQLHSIFGLFGDLPRWLLGSIAFLVALGHLAIALIFSPMVALIVAIGLLLVVVLLGIYFYVIKLNRDRRRAALTGELGQNSFAAPVAVSEMEQLKKLEGLRKTFQSGLEKFRAAGKDIYNLPWYVVIGESGAGKSEIIRRSGVGFPTGMQDELQGTGGTINMDWWFTNNAIILDTAGRLLTEKVPFGDSSEWKEFLKLLRKHRSNCPVNGLILTIPADSLIKDSVKAIEERAGWIARQLANIQRELDIRFPVYVLISKCDLMNGFREFFEHADDPNAQRQMLGWSNPDPLDAPLRPELVDQHLHTVVERLRLARLPLITDPVARDPSHRRVEEVDRLFSFPNSVSLIAENLRRYLSLIFVADEWSPKPLFLRGIYFTSSLREGSELDQELAKALAVPVEKLPEGRAWERDRPFFLRDLFLEKIFREWGLVTRASNTSRLLNRRKWALLGTGIAALAAISFFSWLGYKTMQDSIGDQMEYWSRASEDWTANNWKPLIDSNTGAYAGADAVGRAKSNSIAFDGAQPLLTFHGRLRDRSDAPLNISPVFRVFDSLWTNFHDKRKQAQRVVIEGSIVKPIADAARHSILSAAPASSDASADRERDALFSLIKIESGIVKRRNHYPQEQIAPPQTAIATLAAFTAKEPKKFDASILDVVTWTYAKGDGKGKWPGDWLTGGGTLKSGVPELSYNESIDVGLKHFEVNFALKIAGLRKQWESLEELKKFLLDVYEKAESALWQDAKTANAGQVFDSRLDTPYRTFDEKSVPDLGTRVASNQQNKILDDKVVSLVTAYQRNRADWIAYLAISRSTIDDALKDLEVTELKGGQPSVLLREIRERLQQISTLVKNETVPDLDDRSLTELKRLDQTYLTNTATGRLAYRDRATIYESCFKVTRSDPPGGPYVTMEFKPIAEIKKSIKQAEDLARGYQGENLREALALCDYWLEVAKRKQIDAYLRGYVSEARNELERYLHFPLVMQPEETGVLSDGQVRGAHKFVAAIRADLNSPTYTSVRETVGNTDTRQKMDQFEKNLRLLDSVLNGLVVPDGTRIATFRIELIKGPPRPAVVSPGINPLNLQPNPQPEFFSGLEFRGGVIKDKHGETLAKMNGGTGRRFSEGGEMAKLVLINQVFHVHFLPYNHKPEDELEFGNNWVILRLLMQKKGVSEDMGKTWTVNLEDKNADVPPKNYRVVLTITFEGSIPPFAEWPKKAAFDLGR